jgi:hypothetical protein
MTPKEFQEAARDFCEGAQNGSVINVLLQTSDMERPLWWSFRGSNGRSILTGYADDFDTIMPNLRQKWDALRPQLKAEAIEAARRQILAGHQVLADLDAEV